MSSLKEWVNVYEFSTHRCLFALTSIEARLNPGGDGVAELVALVRRALEAYEATRVLEGRWRGTPTHLLHGVEARRLDDELGRALSALHGALKVELKGGGAEEPLRQAAALVLQRLFPQGLHTLVHLPYVEEAAAVTALLASTESDAEVAEALRGLGFERHVERVRRVHARYVVALQPGDPVTFDEVQAARRENHERLCAIVCLLVARCYLTDPESEEGQAVAGAMQVVREQNRAVRLARRRRRLPPDVDPETGEDLEEPEAEPEVAQPLALPDFDLKSEDAA